MGSAYKENIIIGDKVVIDGIEYEIFHRQRTAGSHLYHLKSNGAAGLRIWEHTLLKHINEQYTKNENEVSAIKPPHYSQGIDAWEIIDRNFTPEQQTGFDAGNVIKYVLRYQHKDGLKDLKKARDYLDRMIKRMEEA